MSQKKSQDAAAVAQNSVASASPDPIVWVLFPGAPSDEEGGNIGRMYEDDGESIAAKAEAPGGEHSAVTTASWSGGCTAGSRLEVSISTRGTHAAMAASRKHALQLRGCTLAPKLATVNGLEIAATNDALAEPTGELGYSVTLMQHERTLVMGGAALRIGLGQHATSEGADVRVSLEF